MHNIDLLFYYFLNSLYDYSKDQKRQNSAANTLPNAINGGSGTIADGNGTGWNTLALKGVWRPEGIIGTIDINGAHIVDLGVQQDRYTLKYRTSNITGNWISDGAGTLTNEVGGKTQLQSLYLQDSWTFNPKWKTVLGARAENWSASSGFTTFGVNNVNNASYAKRSENFVSPKAALSYQLTDNTVLKASTGRAVRMATVSELYGATSTTNSQYINDPNLKPEKSWTTELTAEKDLSNGVLRVTYFTESTKDSLYSQSTLINNISVSRVQNIGRIKTNGIELAYTTKDALIKGLDFSGSATYTDSIIKENAGFVNSPGDTIGKQQPNIARWRASALLSYRIDAQWNASLGLRYSGPQFRTLNNADVNGFTYQGVSRFFTADARVRYQIDKNWSAAFGIDNLNNYKYWNFHPYPQRSYSAELKVDL